MTNKQREIILNRSELIYSMHELGANHLVGLELHEFDLPTRRFQEILKTGKNSLLERLLIEPATNRLIPELADAIKILTLREFAIVLVRGIHGKGKQLFVFNFHQNAIIEHTMPEDGKHRLKHIGSYAEFFSRIKQILPLRPIPTDQRQQYFLSNKLFEQVKDLAPSDIIKARSLLVKSNIPEKFLSSIINALANPIITLAIAFLSIKRDKVEMASSVAVFANKDESWGIWPGNTNNDTSELLAFPTGINDIQSALVDWLGLDKK